VSVHPAPSDTNAPHPAPADPVSSQAAARVPLSVALQAVVAEPITVILPQDRRRVTVQAYLRSEVRWSGPLPSGFDSVPNKPPFELDGVPLYPELLVVRLLERAGWGAAWRKLWNGTAYWRDIRDPVEPSALALSIIDQVTAQAGHAGPWDIVAWRGRELRLLTSRTNGGQLISAYQADWLGHAIRMGVPVGCFAVVEHRVDRPPRRRALQTVKAS
jgi:hypothetical protein